MQQNIIPSIWPVTAHTDHVGPGSTYVVIKGQRLDGIEFIPLALERGAVKIVVEESVNLSFQLVEKIVSCNAQLIRVNNCRKALAELSSVAWGNPAQRLKILAVTGTIGKTTTTSLLAHMVKTAGFKTAMISSVKNFIGDYELPAALTTPQPDYLHAFLACCVEQSIDYVVLEASAQAFSLHRLDGIYFGGIIFTNLSQEHAEFYSSLDEYFAAKLQIFNHCSPSAPAIINIDDAWGKKAAAFYAYSYTVSMHEREADYYLTNKHYGLSGLDVVIQAQDQAYSLTAKNLVGIFNIYNVVDATLLAMKCGISITSIQQALAIFTGVPGRMERYSLANGAYAIIDYAYTPLSFSYVIPMFKSLTEQLIVVFGAGGERDPIKRPIMGNIAATHADIVIITADNPRSENAHDIAQQIMTGISKTDVSKVICELDRKSAIEKAYEVARPGSIILILGKGPDEYQIIGKEKFYFSDSKTILACDNSLHSPACAS